jgi:hypothetical protein
MIQMVSHRKIKIIYIKEHFYKELKNVIAQECPAILELVENVDQNAVFNAATLKIPKLPNAYHLATASN